MSATDEGAFERGVAYLDRAEEILTKAAKYTRDYSGSPPNAAPCTTDRSRLRTAVAAIESAYLGLNDLDDDVTLGVAAEMARGYSLVGRSDEALAVADRALPLPTSLAGQT